MKTRYWFAAICAVIAASPAAAQETQATGGPKAGEFFVRIRAIGVIPQESSGDIEPTFPNEEVKVDNSVMPEIDINYMITDNVGLELIAATTKHTASGRSGTTGSIGKLASTWVLPPTLLVNYHFNSGGAVRPYLGVGLNYTLFYSEKASDGLEAAVGPTDVNMSSSFGPAVQAGIDFDVSPGVFLNADVKWIDMDTAAKLNTTAIGQQKVRVHLDPLVLGVGVGFRL